MDQKVPKDANVIYECSLYQVDFRENPLPCAQQLNALLSQLKLDCALLASKVMDAKVQYALLFKEIEMILRLFLVIAMYCQASSNQFNESLLAYPSPKISNPPLCNG